MHSNTASDRSSVVHKFMINTSIVPDSSRLPIKQWNPFVATTFVTFVSRVLSLAAASSFAVFVELQTHVSLRLTSHSRLLRVSELRARPSVESVNAPELKCSMAFMHRNVLSCLTRAWTDVQSLRSSSTLLPVSSLRIAARPASKLPVLGIDASADCEPFLVSLKT
jgi:hypothetical protein